MKTGTKNDLILAILILLVGSSASFAQLGTDFSYQGRLGDSGQPAAGAYDLEFSLWDSAAVGNQIGSTMTFNGFSVSNGLFTVELDFGAGALNGDDRWLEIVVDGNTLSPRQPVTGAPYAIQTRGIYSEDNGDIGIGTTNPERILHTNGDAVLIERNENDAAVLLRNTKDGVLDASFGLRSTALDEGYAFLTDETQTRLLYLQNGFVGVGRTEPVVPESYFEVEAPVGQGVFGGMFVNTTDDEGFPFYGYATGGASRCFSFYNNQVEKWFLNIGGIHRMVVGEDGRVGINTVAPNYILECNGSAGKPGGGSWTNSSDRRLKKNINGLVGSLEKLLKLRGVSFEYIDPTSINELTGERIGVIAQEVEKVFPDWVGKRPDGYKTVTFRGFEAVAVEAIRELRAENDAQVQELIASNQTLQTENDELRQRLEEVESAVATMWGAQK